MIVIGVDVHKQSLTAAAVDESGRLLAERTLAGGEEGLLAWAAALDGERLWAVEDCRHVSGALERQLVAAGERLVRVPPRLTAPERRAGRRRGKSDAIDALAAARAALREPDLDRPRPGEERLRELKLLVLHRDDLVDERRRCQQRLRWHLHQLDPALEVPAGALDRAVQLERVGRFLARREQTVRVRIARELVARCRSLTRSIRELEQELALRTARAAPSLLELPGCGVLSAAKLLCEIGPIERFRTDAQLARHGGVLRSRQAQAEVSATGSTAAAIANSTARCTGSPSRRRACTRRRAPTWSASRAKERAGARPSAASSGSLPASSSTRSERARP
jgi:transposase